MNWKLFTVHVSICLVVGGIISYFSSARWLAASFWVSASLSLNGSLAFYEDALPGGFDNPDGSNPAAITGGFGALRFWAKALAVAITLAAIGFAIQFWLYPAITS